MKKLRVYADTSVFGGCFDEEFSETSQIFFDEVRRGRFVLVISETLLRELNDAPDRVQKVLAALESEYVEMIETSDEIISLRQEYLKAGVVTENSLYDAEHIASATIAEVDMVISWNFKHIVHFDKINGYHAVNLVNGYPVIRIFSPREVVEI